MEDVMDARSALGLALAVVLSASSGRAAAQDDGNYTLGGPALAVGDPAPGLAVGQFVRGTAVTGFERGTVYVVEFWKVGCPPCRAAIPHLNDLQKKYPAVVFLSVGVFTPTADNIAYLKRTGDQMGYRVAVDRVPPGKDAYTCGAMRVEELQFELRWKLADAGIQDRRVLDAIEAIPRAEFVSLHFRPQAYDLDFPIPIGHGQRMNLLYEDALIAQELRLSGDEQVLEVGSGTGYLTVLLADLARRVVTIERISPLADLGRYYSRGRTNIEYRVGDGALGCAERAPFDRIVLSAAVPELSGALAEQLRPGGVMVLPLSDESSQVLMRVEKAPDGRWRLQGVRPCRFPHLVTAVGAGPGAAADGPGN
jgi:protein-L-isoaspartate(D-aspartate) O-methyltransferase